MNSKVTKEHLDRAKVALDDAVKKAIEKKGDRAFFTQHEALGVLTEENTEFIEAVHHNNHDEERSELLDVAVTAIWAIASMYTRGEE